MNSTASAYGETLATTQANILQRYFNVAASVFYVYDFLITFDHEATVWTSRFKGMKTMFLFNRYMALIATILESFFSIHTLSSPAWCHASMMRLFLAVLLAGNTELVLLKRIWAIYCSAKHIVIATTLLYAVCICTMMGLVIGVIVLDTTDAQSLLISLGCPAGPALSLQLMVGTWIPMMIFDFVLAALALNKAISHRREVVHKEWPAVRLLNCLARDSVFYFLINFSVYFFATLQYKYGSLQTMELASALCLVIPPVSVTRLFVSMHNAVHGDEDEHNMVAISFSFNHSSISQLPTPVSEAHVGVPF